jgi:predicted Zn finger-like uncharacterized protein
MLIVCPNCATSYMIDQAAVGPAGRTVRCARCKASWVAGGPEPAPDVTASVDTANAEAEAPSAPAVRAKAPQPVAAAAPPPPPTPADTGSADAESTTATETMAPPVEPPQREPAPEPAPVEAQAPETEPATIADAPPLVPPIEPEAAIAEPDSEEAESEAASFDARRKLLQARRKQSRRSSRWTAVILVLVACNVALVGARSEVVRYLPQTASLFAAVGLPVNLRNLKFENVKILKEAQDGIDTLVVQGAIASEAGKPVAVPRLRFAARNSTGQEVYTWTMPPPRSILGPSERLEFRSQIPASPADARDVMVRFFTANDAGAK